MTWELARQLTARRRAESKRCAVCGAPSTGIARKLYSGSTCTIHTYRERKAMQCERRRRGQGSMS